MSDIDYIGANELVFNTNKDSNIYSGGFSVKSIMMGNGMSPIMTINSENQQSGGGNKVSDLFQSLVIPNWVLTYNKTIGGSYKDESDDDSDIDDELHDKLLGLVKEHDNKLNQQKPKKKTRKHSSSKKGGTKKNKK
jgi:hypothetical protein